MRVLAAPTNRLADLRLLLPRLLPAIDQTLAGQVVMVNQFFHLISGKPYVDGL